MRASEKVSWALQRIALVLELRQGGAGVVEIDMAGACSKCGSLMRDGVCPTWECSVCGQINPSGQPTGPADTRCAQENGGHHFAPGEKVCTCGDYVMTTTGMMPAGST